MIGKKIIIKYEIYDYNSRFVYIENEELKQRIRINKNQFRLILNNYNYE